jgi:hypothetical protein
VDRFNAFAVEKAWTVGDVYRALVAYHSAREEEVMIRRGRGGGGGGDEANPNEKIKMKGVFAFIMGFDEEDQETDDTQQRNCVIA